ncbi:hypothetical protein GO730_04185 [Spirosoma sp. HMF3257]|uniref:hypothetical protein n=1 Tax=Spirosoma telluris TaxID=2183553 RepID=UPI0011B93F74|nr:hypothetical protein [Spirosoma telluris]
MQATDANGCSGIGETYTLVINSPIPTLSNLSASSATLCAGSPVTFTATVGNVSGSYNYTLANGTSPALTGTATSTAFSQSLITTDSGTQTFSLTVGSNGQTITAATTLTVNTLPSLSVSPTSATLTNASPATTLTATGTGSFLWSTGQNSSVISVTASGLYSVTLTNANGCSSTASVPVTGSDLTINIDLPQANFAASGTASVGNFVVNVFEVGGLPTSSGNVRITITAPVGYTLSFPPSLTAIQVTGGSLTPINNAQWTVSTNLANRQLTLTMASGAFIGAGGESSLGFSMTRTSANSGSVSSITVNVADDLTMTYDGNLANNVYARVISGL